jgi:hypothetical protein
MLIANQQYWSTNSKHGYYRIVSTLAVIFFVPPDVPSDEPRDVPPTGREFAVRGAERAGQYGELGLKDE